MKCFPLNPPWLQHAAITAIKCGSSALLLLKRCLFAAARLNPEPLLRASELAGQQAAVTAAQSYNRLHLACTWLAVCCWGPVHWRVALCAAICMGVCLRCMCEVAVRLQKVLCLQRCHAPCDTAAAVVVTRAALWLQRTGGLAHNQVGDGADMVLGPTNTISKCITLSCIYCPEHKKQGMHDTGSQC